MINLECEMSVLFLNYSYDSNDAKCKKARACIFQERYEDRFLKWLLVKKLSLAELKPSILIFFIEEVIKHKKITTELEEHLD